MEAVPPLGLKRRYEEVDGGSPFSTPKDSDDDVSSSDGADSCDSLNPPPGAAFTPTSILRRHRPSPAGKRVRFDVVTVYYFPRRQGFTSVPSQGGSSLGMARRHASIRRYTLGEFAHEQETSHRRTLRQHLRQEKLDARKMTLTRNGTVACSQADLLTLDDVSDEDLDVDGVAVDECFFLQPLPTKRRRALLRASGLARIDAREKAELRTIRLSREECGCDCRLYCDPRRCGCSQAGIKCQVDRMSFPCGCSRDGCANGAGRIEFNPLRVRTHYLHTIMKLDLETRRTPLRGAGGAPSSPSSTCPTSPDLSSVAGLDSELEGSQVQTVLEVQDLLERENETAVLHLQSAEEQERREREEAEGEAVRPELGAGGLVELPEQVGVPGVERVLLQGPFPTGATVLCITNDQEEEEEEEEEEERPSDLLKDSTSLLYYQLSPFETRPREEESLAGGDEPEQSKEEKISCRPSVGEPFNGVVLRSEEAGEERPSGPKLPEEARRLAASCSEGNAAPLPPEV
ncbi:cysteine/serine-rich nuclear protein 2 [Brachionichthys hirsutus]|uniref:cysteine/serine-rich nuclear protein 2 n=1 Tax=Brachionichthys hirsutus TaxID=412623 RepID=UPI0036043C8E